MTYHIIIYVDFYHFGQFSMLKDYFSTRVLVISPPYSSYVLRLPFDNNSSVTSVWSVHSDLRTPDVFLKQEAGVCKLNRSRFLKYTINNGIKSNFQKKYCQKTFQFKNDLKQWWTLISFCDILIKKSSEVQTLFKVVWIYSCICKKKYKLTFFSFIVIR